MEKGLQ